MMVSISFTSVIGFIRYGCDTQLFLRPENPHNLQEKHMHTPNEIQLINGRPITKKKKYPELTEFVADYNQKAA